MRSTKNHLPSNPCTIKDAGKMLQEDTEDKSYKRYKNICYCNLVLKGLVFFVLGIFCCYLLKQL